MLKWFKNKSELDKLKERYCRLMKKSFKIALRDRKRSDKLRKEAKVLYDRIKKYDTQKKAS